MKNSPAGVPANESYVRSRDHAKIRAIVDAHIANSDPIDFNLPGKLDALTNLVIRKMAPTHKYYMAMDKAKKHIREAMPLYKSVKKFLHQVYVAGEEPQQDSNKKER